MRIRILQWRKLDDAGDRGILNVLNSTAASALDWQCLLQKTAKRNIIFFVILRSSAPAADEAGMPRLLESFKWRHFSIEYYR